MFFLESNEETKNNNILENTVRTKNFVLELIPPKKILNIFWQFIVKIY